MMRIAYTDNTGNLCIVIAAPKEALERVLGPLTDEGYRAHVYERSIPKDATDIHDLPDDWQPPSDRKWRNAWRSENGRVGICMDKARGICRDRLRAKRKPMLEALDAESLRAQEDGDAARLADIKARKQALRDAPANPKIDAATTLDELDAITL